MACEEDEVRRSHSVEDPEITLTSRGLGKASLPLRRSTRGWSRWTVRNLLALRLEESMTTYHPTPQRSASLNSRVEGKAAI